MSTIFKKIIDGQIQAKVIYDDEHCLAFHDVAPQAPVHALLIPKVEIASLDLATEDHAKLFGHMMVTLPKVAAILGIAPGGYRIVLNVGNDGGQTVHHLHFHILGGRKMAWPPG
jgi:histidine triad (HIT) family protein